MRLAIVALAIAQVAQPSSPRPDPHAGQYTTAIAPRCASCHDASNPRAEDMRNAAASMQAMVTSLNRGVLKPFGGVTCFSCHRGGGPEHQMAHPLPLDRNAARALIAQWPGDSHDSDATRRTMSEYVVSLGVKCDYCHLPANWKADAKPAMKTTRAMEEVMKEFPKAFSLARAAVFSCSTCHQGDRRIAR